MNSAELQREWDALEAAGFDGHTEFEALTPLQRLHWLAQAVRFWHLAQGCAVASEEQCGGI
jgi:hypothetical protein